MKHPKTIEEITAPWMTAVLQNAGILQRASVHAADVQAIGQGYRLSAIMATLNPVLVYYMFKTGGGRGTALGTAMTERFFCDLLERGAEAVVP